MDPEQFELLRRCGELAGVLHEETGLQVEVSQFFGDPSLWRVNAEGTGWGWEGVYEAGELLSREPRDIADELGTWLRDRNRRCGDTFLRTTAKQANDGEDHEKRQHDQDHGVGALTGHIHWWESFLEERANTTRGA